MYKYGFSIRIKLIQVENKTRIKKSLTSLHSKQSTSEVEGKTANASEKYELDMQN